MRFAENKPGQQIVQKIAAVAVRQRVRMRNIAPATGVSYRPDKALPDTHLVGHSIRLCLRRAGEEHPAQRVVQLGGVEF